MTENEKQILNVMRKLQRDFQPTAQRGIYPWQIVPWLDEYRCEQTLRRDMARLWRKGRLVRIGGYNARKGYVIAPQGTPPVFIKPLQFPYFQQQKRGA